MQASRGLDMILIEYRTDPEHGTDAFGYRPAPVVYINVQKISILNYELVYIACALHVSFANLFETSNSKIGTEMINTIYSLLSERWCQYQSASY